MSQMARRVRSWSFSAVLALAAAFSGRPRRPDGALRRAGLDFRCDALCVGPLNRG